jgi:protoheme ferro-lyase
MKHKAEAPNVQMSARTYRILFSSHAIPQWFNPLSAQYPKHHHERVEEVIEIPPAR